MNMKKMRIAAVVLLGFLFGSIVMGGVAGAHTFRGGNDTNVGRDEVIDGSLFIAGSNVNVDGEVFGDVFCAGQTITVSGKIHGDVLCAGQTVRINGDVTGDVRAAGQTVSVSSIVDGNATVAGQTFTLESSGSVGGDITIGSTDALLNGTIGRDLAVGGNKVVVTSNVGRNIKGSLEKLELTDTAVINGDIEFTSPRDLERAAEATVLGSITRTAPESTTSKRGAVFGFSLLWFLYWFLAMLVVALALALLFPGVLHDTTQQAMQRPWKPLLVGAVASIAIPVFLVLLLFSIIGIPLAIVLGLIWVAIAIVSGPFSGYYIGRQLLVNSRNALAIMFIGAGLLITIYFIPIIGFIALLVSFWIGAGMILLELLRRTPRPAYTVTATHHRSKKTKK